MDKNKVAVVIPFYKPDLTAYEIIALQQCQKVLSGYPIIAIKPNSLQLPAETTQYGFSDTISFDDAYFANIQGYNRLMLDEVFYSEFLSYEYILVYQLDAFVFRDELTEWCNRDIDYIGAPWVKARKHPAIMRPFKKLQYYLHTRYDFQKNGLPTNKQFDYKVGNGGFSLRRTKIFHDLCISERKTIDWYNKQESHLFNEDMFWSVEVNRKNKTLNIPSYKTGLKFAFEFFPERAYEINHHQLPFGCHAWDRYVDFWQPVFKQYGYDI